MVKKLLLKLFKRKNDGRYKLSGKFATFLVCLFISIFFWFITTFSKEYTTVINFPVSYANFPKGRVLMNHLKNNFDVEITARGFTLLYYKFVNGTPEIKIDLKEARPSITDNNYFIALNNKTDKYAKQLGSTIQIIRINPDTLFLDYRKRVVKTLPVKLNSEITYDKSYELKDSIRVKPGYISIAGPEELLNKIKTIETEKFKLEDVDEEINEEVELAFNFDTSLVSLSAKKVKVNIPVVKYTEGTFEIPVEVDNLPKKKSVKLFPAKVTVKYYVPFDEFEKIDASSFRVRADYSKKGSGKKLKVEVVKKPESVKSIKVSPEKVEFILRK